MAPFLLIQFSESQYILGMKTSNIKSLIQGVSIKRVKLKIIFNSIKYKSFSKILIQNIRFAFLIHKLNLTMTNWVVSVLYSPILSSIKRCSKIKNTAFNSINSNNHNPI